ncbi:MAG: sensor histidine kinase [Anaerocolumna sp.]|nr:sensor histidine kinase [Anaerocolumna sp.]
MHKKLYASYLVLIVVAISLSGLIFWSRSYNYTLDRSKEHYLSLASLVSDVLSDEKYYNSNEYEEFVNRFAKKYDIRITIIDQYGEVFADSDTNGPMENHKTREEVIEALNGKSSSVTRYSSTMGQMYSYSAVPVTTGEFSGVLRIAVPLSEIKDLNNQIINSIIYAVLICFVLAIILAAFFTGLLTRPISEVAMAAGKISKGEYNIKIYTRDKSIVGKLASSFNVMAANLKSTIENLTRRNAELEAMLSSMAAGVVAVSDSSEILFYNKAFKEFVNFPKDELQGISLYNVIRNSAVFEAIDEVKGNNTSIVKVGMITNKNIQYIRVTATPLGQEGEQIFGVLLIIEDITKIKKLENMRTDFVSNVTHELKTPLTSIRGFIDTLKQGAIQEEAVAHRFLDIIDIEAERLYSLIQDILILSEIESKREYEVMPCDINECVESVIELLKPKLTEKVKFEFDPKPYLRPYYCNPDRMKQIFINLMDNAVKYTEEGSITITCSEVDNRLLLSIRDTGIGIRKEHLSRIFERFYRVDKGRSRKQGGTGLGLSIVKHIVELYNGNLEVNSRPGEGTEFIISLPYNSNGNKM